MLGVLTAVAGDTDEPLFVMLDEDDRAGLDALTRLGFEPARRESEYTIPAAEATDRLVDDLNLASQNLLLSLGARRVGGLVELVRRP